MKAYEAPELFVDEYVADTMIASSGGGTGLDIIPKNGAAANNHNCWSCDNYAGEVWYEDKTSSYNACHGFFEC